MTQKSSGGNAKLAWGEGLEKGTIGLEERKRKTKRIHECTRGGRTQSNAPNKLERGNGKMIKKKTKRKQKGKILRTGVLQEKQETNNGTSTLEGTRSEEYQCDRIE